MSILMAALTPHPPIIIPEIGKDRRKEVKKTINKMEEIAEEVINKEPDLIITISPHGPVFTDAISILDQEEIEGDFSDFACPEVTMKIKTDQKFIKALKNNAVDEDIEVITLSSADLEKYNFPAKLDHGVMVPLYFLKDEISKIPVIPITMGLLDYDSLYDFGKTIQETVEQMSLKAVVIASGDLSHRLKPGAPAGYNPRAKDFDHTLIGLLKDEKYSQVLNIDKGLIEKAGECGLRPIVIMLGTLRKKNFKADLKSYEDPFGVGYGVIGFNPLKSGVDQNY
ncbi:AmmeMemoRadiSam system protein B [Natronospora cellulosivora (SeqCode)]